jgi:hypothetical protein
MFEIAQRRVPFSRILFHLALALSLMWVAGIASAKPENITETEMRLLPSYCRDTQTFGYGDSTYNTSPRAAHWVSYMGKSFWAMHHYCWALINMNRSRRASLPANERVWYWESARGDYGYVINNSPPDFIMLPEIYTRIGEVELLLKHPDKANDAFAKARKLKPDYWPAYSHWAEFLIQIGRRPDALKIVISGLQHSPGAKVLLEQLRVLGGKVSDIPKTIENAQPVIDPISEPEQVSPNNPLIPDAKLEEK